MAGRFTLNSEVRFIPGIGPVRAREFARLGVNTVGDLIEYFPFRYELRPQSVPIDQLELNRLATVVGELRGVRTRGPNSRQSVNATLVDGTGSCVVRWFNSPFLVDRLHHGQIVRLTGKVDVYSNRASLTNPQLTLIDDQGDPFLDDRDRYDPVYSGSAELPSASIANAVRHVLDEVIEQVVDFLPESIRQLRSLPPRRTAVLRFHRPTSTDEVPVARRRFAYEELLLCQVAVQMSRQRQAANAEEAPVIKTTREIDQRIRKRLPFALTPGQDQAVAEICEDLALSRPMNRLIQADVGTGKTAVAVYAALTTIAHKKQVALLAPTEVLASQHWAKIEQYLDASRVHRAYLVGSTTRVEQSRVLKALAAGEIDFIIGTHALLEPDVRFADLGLVIVDEQHKFGVAQRAALRAKGRAPHTLVLTATPIPRTLAMTLFGDLDVSTIRGAPPGRKPVTTRVVTSDLSAKAWSFVRSRIAKGEQAFIVYPLVEESEDLPLKAATVEVRQLSQSVLTGCRLGLLHGRMKPAEKQDVMQRFHAGDIQVLVSTTVIEVGVDVPRATMMIVQHAERYGLSQLHQLRGRIGRGDLASFCLLFTDSTSENSLERLRILCESTDGFRIAEEDLRLRGPGELLGRRQHGLPAFRVADLIQDIDLLEHARDDAAKLIRHDADLSRPEHTELRRRLLERYGQYLDLLNVA